MSDPLRRTIEELRTRYELEPSIHDLYVEGVFDQEVLSRHIEKDRRVNIVVYSIDTVEIPNVLLEKYGLTRGNKQEVIALARQLADLPTGCSFRCIVDTDLDYWLGRLEDTPRLVWTKHCSIELYFFDETVLRDILVVAAQVRLSDLPSFLSSMAATLRHIFSMRLADSELGWCMKWLDFEDHLKQRSGAVHFDENEYIRRLLLRNGKYGKRDEFSRSRERWLERLIGDPRSFIRGHDLIRALAWTIRAFRGTRNLHLKRALRGFA